MSMENESVGYARAVNCGADRVGGTSGEELLLAARQRLWAVHAVLGLAAQSGGPGIDADCCRAAFLLLADADARLRRVLPERRRIWYGRRCEPLLALLHACSERARGEGPALATGAIALLLGVLEDVLCEAEELALEGVEELQAGAAVEVGA